jgi:protein-S-isoprenylcysteine O-methyltransferase Ste14
VVTGDESSTMNPWIAKAVILVASSLGQVLVLPNWIAGPSYLVTFGILFAFRIRDEERMMLEEFGDEYATYMAKTKRLVPGIW